MRLWKWLGLAGIAGVAATGAVVARDQRRRRVMTPEQVRDRLHERHAAAVDPAAGPRAGGSGAGGTTPRS